MEGSSPKTALSPPSPRRPLPHPLPPHPAAVEEAVVVARVVVAMGVSETRGKTPEGRRRQAAVARAPEEADPGGWWGWSLAGEGRRTEAAEVAASLEEGWERGEEGEGSPAAVGSKEEEEEAPARQEAGVELGSPAPRQSWSSPTGMCRLQIWGGREGQRHCPDQASETPWEHLITSHQHTPSYLPSRWGPRYSNL